MSAPQQLTEQQRNRLQTAHYSLPRREMVRYWLLSTDDIRRINEKRREHNRLGFAVQLCLLRYPGWPLKVGEKPPSNLLEFVAQQIDADPDEFGDLAMHLTHVAPPACGLGVVGLSDADTSLAKGT